MIEFIENYRISGKIICQTGLHIGGSSDTLGIGGSDSPVILDRIQKVPIIPGSSLKGKMRSALELKYSGLWLDKSEGKVHTCKEPGCNLCTTFGRGATERVMAGPTRLIVRDAMPDAVTKEAWKDKDGISHGTEIKGENFLNRITSMATPRFIERVPAGSAFDFEMIFTIYSPEDQDRLKLVLEAMSILEDSYLGGSGSRGYGKIAFADIVIARKDPDSYREGRDWEPLTKAEGETTARGILASL
ncbi:hypothetical protein RJ53_09400 [Methanocalculus chunghsingensis]|uniref:CRISPR system Cms endoribonuclease Csm3 n=1 Tax=Methanocalculus chunghsingensis TaxID=156457 RepID=A0A8J7WBH4_9EURY|nr:type III-A CRISPR-associated RAMP protein Csm3 [Methanocalculus chunghsingensis]MBR1369678.1 hypothetical protein [Methanocalculus chunghsingensis]